MLYNEVRDLVMIYTNTKYHYRKVTITFLNPKSIPEFIGRSENNMFSC